MPAFLPGDAVQTAGSGRPLLTQPSKIQHASIGPCRRCESATRLTHTRSFTAQMPAGNESSAGPSKTRQLGEERHPEQPQMKLLSPEQRPAEIPELKAAACS